MPIGQFGFANMLYYKNKDGELIPVDVSYFNLENIENSLLLIKVGDKEFQPNNEDIKNIVEEFHKYFSERNIKFTGLVTHDKISVEILDKDQFKDKIVVVKVGDKDEWKPTEDYMREIKQNIQDAFFDAGIKDVVVLDVLSSIDIGE